MEMRASGAVGSVKGVGGATLHSAGNSYWGLVWKKNCRVGGERRGGWAPHISSRQRERGINEAIKASGSLRGIVGGRAG